MAPEALKDLRFSIKSDVYSYGITLWELMTRGRTPFEFLTLNELINQLDSGQRLTNPDGCPDLINIIMAKCWMQNPQDRPNFREIYQELSLAIEMIDNLERPEEHSNANSIFHRFSRNRNFDYRRPETREILDRAQEYIIQCKIGNIVMDPSRDLECGNVLDDASRNDYLLMTKNIEEPPEYSSLSPEVVDGFPLGLPQCLSRTSSLPMNRPDCGNFTRFLSENN